jgi:glycine betaine/proline transport system substrate-binding protein
MIADQKLTPEEAAKKWVDGHESVWKKWLP